MSICKKNTVICTCALFLLALVLLCSFILISAKDIKPLLEDVALMATNHNISAEPITSSLKEYIGRINGSGRWDSLDNDNYTYSIVEVKPGQDISFKCYTLTFMAFLKTYHEPVKGERPDFANFDNGYSERFSFRSGVHKLIVPEGVNYLYFSRKLNGSDSTPRYLYVDYENVLEGFFPEVVQNVFEDYPVEKQQICIHHDSFCRGLSGKKWHIGTNGGEVFTMDYSSPRSDYDYVDDGFRIIDGYLTNDQNVSVGEALRLIKRKLSDESLIEVALPEIDNMVERIVFNFKDISNFNYYQIKRNKNRTIIDYVTRRDGQEIMSRVLSENLVGKSLRFFSVPNGFYVYLDNKKIASVESKLNPALQCGLMIDNKHTYKYRFFNVFQLSPYKIYDESRFSDNGIKETHGGIKQGWVRDYSYTLDTERAQLSPYAERFELRRNTVSDYTNDRVEKSFNYQLQTNLRKIKIEFDVLIPEDFEKDVSKDCIMQIHDRPDDVQFDGRSPYFAIRIQNNQFILTTMSIEKHVKSGFSVNDIVPLANCKLGEWSHFSVYMKEGYILEHNPLIKIMVDGRVVYESNKLNANNNPRGGYVRYGIYKADWLNKPDGITTNKIVYFDNFKVVM